MQMTLCDDREHLQPQVMLDSPNVYVQQVMSNYTNQLEALLPNPCPFYGFWMSTLRANTGSGTDSMGTRCTFK